MEIDRAEISNLDSLVYTVTIPGSVREVHGVTLRCSSSALIGLIRCARETFYARRTSFSPVFRSLLLSSFFFLPKTSRHRCQDLHNCERLFVLVSWPHTRSGTLGACLWSWFICKWPGTLAHCAARGIEDWRFTGPRISLRLPISGLVYFSFSFSAHTSTLLDLFLFSSLSFSYLTVHVLFPLSSVAISLYFSPSIVEQLFLRFSSEHRVSPGSIWKSCSSASTAHPCILWLQFPARFGWSYVYTGPLMFPVMYLHLSAELEFEAPLINDHFGIRKFQPRYCIINVLRINNWLAWRTIQLPLEISYV